MKRGRGIDRHNSKYSPLNWKNLPSGIKVLSVYMSLIAVFYLLYLVLGISKPVSVIFGTFIYGMAASIVEIISLILLVTIIYGLVKRHYWVFWLSLGWFSFGLLNAIVSLARFNSEFDVLKNILFASSLIIVVLNGIIVWYVYSEKYYFKVRHLNKTTKAKDKFFVYIISSFIIVSVLIMATFGVSFYTTTLKETKKIIADLQSSPLQELTCAQKTGEEQDLCYVVLSVMRDGKDSSLCDNIKSDFYKITCVRSLT